MDAASVCWSFLNGTCVLVMNSSNIHASLISVSLKKKKKKAHLCLSSPLAEVAFLCFNQPVLLNGYNL